LTKGPFLERGAARAGSPEEGRGVFMKGERLDPHACLTRRLAAAYRLEFYTKPARMADHSHDHHAPPAGPPEGTKWIEVSQGGCQGRPKKASQTVLRGLASQAEEVREWIIGESSARSSAIPGSCSDITRNKESARETLTHSFPSVRSAHSCSVAFVVPGH
jgi:hypothetical protein